MHSGNSKESHSDCHANNLEFSFAFLDNLKKLFSFSLCNTKDTIISITISFSINCVFDFYIHIVSVYLNCNMYKNKCTFVSFIIILIYLESFSTLASKYNSIHSDKYNIFSTRTRRQILFGGKYSKVLRLLQTHDKS